MLFFQQMNNRCFKRNFIDAIKQFGFVDNFLNPKVVKSKVLRRRNGDKDLNASGLFVM